MNLRRSERKTVGLHALDTETVTLIFDQAKKTSDALTLLDRVATTLKKSIHRHLLDSLSLGRGLTLADCVWNA